MSTRKPRSNGIERAAKIIECLVELGQSATAYQIAKRIDSPLSTTYETMALLERLEILRRCGAEGHYYLGPRLLFYGLAYSGCLEEDEIFRHEADTLARACGENVQVCIRDGDFMVVAVMADGRDGFRISSRPGSRTPLNWSASGRLLVGHLSPEERGKIFNRTKPSPTGRALTDPAELEKACGKAWEQGYCIQIAESDFAVACIAAPIKNARGECVATFSLVVPEATAEKRGTELARQVIESTRKIERQLGWQNHAFSAGKHESAS